MSRVFRVSRSGFYAWLARQGKPWVRQQRREEVDRAVKETFEAGKRCYGSPRLTLDLVANGTPYNRKTVAASQHRQGLRVQGSPKVQGHHELEAHADGSTQSVAAGL